MTKPHRAVKLVLSVEADNDADFAEALEHVWAVLHNSNNAAAFGQMRFSWQFHIKRDPSMTNKEYFRRLTQHLKETQDG